MKKGGAVKAVKAGKASQQPGKWKLVHDELAGMVLQRRYNEAREWALEWISVGTKAAAAARLSEAAAGAASTTSSPGASPSTSAAMSDTEWL